MEEKPYIIVIHKPSGRGYSLNRGYGLLNYDLGFISPPEDFVEEWDEWLAGTTPRWVNEMGEHKDIQDQFHAYWLY